MEPQESDTELVRYLIGVHAKLSSIAALIAKPYASEDADKRSAMATLRNQARQIVAGLERAILAARRIG